LGYLNRLKGFDDNISLEFAQNFHNLEEQKYSTTIKVLWIKFNEPILVSVARLLFGFPWDKEERKLALYAKKYFLETYENMEETNNGVKRETLPSPWDEVTM
jgi:hypothetical protein